jgi:hypothetical protein
VAVAVVAVAVEHFAARWQIMPSLPDFASLLVDPDLSDLAAFAPVKVALLVEVVGFAMHFAVVAKPVDVVERLVAVAMPAVFVLGLGFFELHSDLHLLVAHWVYRCHPERSL